MAPNQSSTPTRPHPSTQPSKQHTLTLTHALSPLNSQDGRYTPQATSYQGPDSPDTSQGGFEGLKKEDPSMVAVYGSVPSSPILKARRRGLKESSVYGSQRQEWIKEGQAQERSIDEKVHDEPMNEMIEQDQLTPNKGRVIAIHVDLIYPFSIKPVEPQTLQLMPDSLDQKPPPQNLKGTTSGLAVALRQLHTMGHPLHLVSSSHATERGEIVNRLAGQGINVGTEDDDLVAALWFIEPTSTTPEVDTRVSGIRQVDERSSQAELKVLRAINAALYICGPDRPSKTILAAQPSIPVIQLTQKDRPNTTSPVQPFFPAVKDRELPTSPHVLERWGEVIGWVNNWDKA